MPRMKQSQSTQDKRRPLEEAEEKAPLKNHNPNEGHNTKKVSLGPNTKR